MKRIWLINLKVSRFLIIAKETPENVGGLYRINFVTQEKEYYEIYKFDLFKFKRISLNILEQLEILGL